MYRVSERLWFWLCLIWHDIWVDCFDVDGKIDNSLTQPTNDHIYYWGGNEVYGKHDIAQAKIKIRNIKNLKWLIGNFIWEWFCAVELEHTCCRFWSKMKFPVKNWLNHSSRNLKWIIFYFYLRVSSRSNEMK